MSFPESRYCFFVVILFHAVAHSMVCNGNKPYRHLALLQSIDRGTILESYTDFPFVENIRSGVFRIKRTPNVLAPQ